MKRINISDFVILQIVILNGKYRTVEKQQKIMASAVVFGLLTAYFNEITLFAMESDDYQLVAIVYITQFQLAPLIKKLLGKLAARKRLGIR